MFNDVENKGSGIPAYDKYTKVWSGPKKTRFFDADCSIGRILFSFLRNNSINICQISATDKRRCLTHGEILVFGIRIAQYLRSMGLKHDSVVGVFGTNSTFLLPTILGCLFNCTPFNGIDPQSDEATVRYLFSVTRPKVIFCDGNLYPKISIIAKILKAEVFTLNQHRYDLPKIEELLEPTIKELHYNPESLKLGGDQTVAILCTSGSGGMPKSVCISNTACLFDFGFMANRDIELSFNTIDSPMCFFNMISCCAHGATRILTDVNYPTSEQLLELIEKFKVTLVTLTPQQIDWLLKSPSLDKEKLRSIRFMAVTGGYCYTKTLLKMQEILRSIRTGAILSYGYDLTECGGVTANFNIMNPGTEGSLLAGVKVKIVDKATNTNLGPNEIGEIVVYNERSWNGYYANPHESRRMRDYQGWYHTGDMGYVDSERCLHVIGRRKDALNFHGLQYWPQEIEQVVAELEDVIEVCVFGLWNEVDGDAAAAAVVKVQGSKLSEQEIVEYVASRLIVEHKQLHCGVFFLDELPRTSRGVVKREEARDLALGKKWVVAKSETEKK